MFFVVSTGRSGTTTIANSLSQHPFCKCLHQPHPVLIPLTAERCHGRLDDDDLRRCLFQPKPIFPVKASWRLYGESDQRLSFIIPFLAELGPLVKFIWLIRDGRKVVASCVARDWYNFDEYQHHPHLWAKYRIQGDLCGDVGVASWQKMSPFEKCCWYWSYTNRIIDTELRKLDSKRSLLLRLEEIVANFDNILDFLNLAYYPIKITHANPSPKDSYSYNIWNEYEKRAFLDICGTEMNRWYPGWQDGQEFHSPSLSFDDTGRLRLGKSLISHAGWMTKKIYSRISRSFLSLLMLDGHK